MDIRCSKCGEPWDLDTLHDVADENGTDFDTERRRFYRDGCKALGSRCGTVDREAAGVAGMLQDLLGDDIDGVAAMLDDWEMTR